MTTPTQETLALLLSELSALRESWPGMPELPERAVAIDVPKDYDGDVPMFRIPNDTYLAVVERWVMGELRATLASLNIYLEIGFDGDRWGFRITDRQDKWIDGHDTTLESLSAAILAAVSAVREIVE